ncbi:MAG TPA: heavy metal-responsive transcriptional regulator [Rhodanobacteraceae bacterium]
MQIGEVVAATGFTADTLRFYEKIRLLPHIARNASGRRSYDREDLSRLAFIRRAQHMRFSLDETRALLQLRERGGRDRPQALQLAEQKLAAIERALVDMQALHIELTSLVNLCQTTPGDTCPILKKLGARQRTTG